MRKIKLFSFLKKYRYRKRKLRFLLRVKKHRFKYTTRSPKFRNPVYLYFLKRLKRFRIIEDLKKEAIISFSLPRALVKNNKFRQNLDVKTFKNGPRAIINEFAKYFFVANQYFYFSSNLSKPKFNFIKNFRLSMLKYYLKYYYFHPKLCNLVKHLFKLRFIYITKFKKFMLRDFRIKKSELINKVLRKFFINNFKFLRKRGQRKVFDIKVGSSMSLVTKMLKGEYTFLSESLVNSFAFESLASRKIVLDKKKIFNDQIFNFLNYESPQFSQQFVSFIVSVSNKFWFILKKNNFYLNKISIFSNFKYIKNSLYINFVPRFFLLVKIYDYENLLIF